MERSGQDGGAVRWQQREVETTKGVKAKEKGNELGRKYIWHTCICVYVYV